MSERWAKRHRGREFELEVVERTVSRSRVGVVWAVKGRWFWRVPSDGRDTWLNHERGLPTSGAAKRALRKHVDDLRAKGVVIP